MSERQRAVLRAVRLQAQHAAIEAHHAAQAEVERAAAAVRDLDAQRQAVALPPAAGRARPAHLEAQRRAHLRHLDAQMQQAQAALVACRAQAEIAEAALGEAVRALKAVDVLDERAATAQAREARRRAELDAQERNARRG